MKNKSLNKHRNLSAMLAAGILALGWSPAMAGEVDGKGNPVPGGTNGRSECSFSGQQDDAEMDAGFFRGDRVQSWGQIPKWLRDLLSLDGVHPGNACNPRKSGN